MTTADKPCTSPTKTFTVKVNLFAGEFGYYTMDECGGTVNPTIGLEVGETYTFVQEDISNYYHPLGFAYFPHGAHEEQDELEPGISQTGSDCASSLSCPAPMYFLDGNYLGKYSNIPDVLVSTTGEDDFGLDHYEPLFFHPVTEWTEQGTFSVKLRFDDTDYTKDLFYFCHIHKYMTGRIKLLKDGNVIQETDDPDLSFEYDGREQFDESCGTTGLHNYQLPHSECPKTFICDADDLIGTSSFIDCINAMNCNMVAGMTTKFTSKSNKALFYYHMIPHHQNAVNMAKALMNTGDVKCDDILDETDDCVLESILRDIINTQNYQIQVMQSLLDNGDFPEQDDCVVALSDGEAKKEESNANGLSLSIAGFLSVVFLAFGLM